MKSIYTLIFSASCSILIYEISLTRIFSISFWYHFAFLVISMAMLGIGGAGTALSVLTIFNERHNTLRKYWDYAIRDTELLSGLAIFAGTSILLCFTASARIPFDPAKIAWDPYQLIFLGLYCFVLSIPFFCVGLIIVYSYFNHSIHSMFIYSADVTGAASGAFLVLSLLNIYSPEYAVLFASVLCIAGSLFVGRITARIIALCFIGMILATVILDPAVLQIKISPYKKLSFYLKIPAAEHLGTYNNSYSRIDLFKSPGLRYAPGLSLKYGKSIPDQVGVAIDGDIIDAITDARDYSAIEFLKFIPSALPYEISNIESVFVINPRGGLHVLLSRFYQAKSVVVAESIPLINDVIRRNLQQFSGNIYGHDSYRGYGRNILHRSGISLKNHSTNKFDLIDIPLMSATVSGHFGISEDYSLTVEAFSEYFRSLKRDGMLSINLYTIPPPRAEFRILTTALTALERLIGRADLSNNVVAIKSWDSMTILIKKSSFTSEETEKLKGFAKSRNFELVYYPGIRSEEIQQFIKTPEPLHFEGFRDLIDPDRRSSFIDDYLFDISPVFDNNPFSHYYLKLKNVRAIYRLMSSNWLYFINEGYLLPFVLVIVILLCVILIFAPIIFYLVYTRFSHKHQTTQLRHISITILYFSMLGMGYMFVEIVLIQKCILILENPSIAVSVTVVSLLFSSGTGSLVSSIRSFRLSSALIIILILICIYIIALPLFLKEILLHDLILRIILTSIMIMPLGFVMGIPFPHGMRLVGRYNSGLIPWAWASNACMSVISPILAVMIAISLGIRAELIIAFLVYLIALMSLNKMSPSAGKS